jgi:hypothetical protein
MEDDVRKEIELMKQQHLELKTAVSKQQSAIEENTELTKTIAANTEAMVKFFKDLQSGIRLLSYVGAVAKWLAVVAAGSVVVITIIKTGQLPPAKL